MSKLTIPFMVCIITFLSSANAKALNVVENYCSDKAQLGSWQEGIVAKKDIRNIVAEFDSEHAALVSYLDQLPVQSPESVVLAGMKVRPQSTTPIGKEFTRFQWDIQGEKSHLNIILMIYKGCISQISLMDSNRKAFFSRQTTLPTQP